MAYFVSLNARQILDSRGNPTVEAEVVLDDGSIGRASVPSGASTGAHEALELRDEDPQHYLGKSVEKAVKHIKTELAAALKDNDPFDQESCDSEMVLRDSTPNLAHFGANAVLSVSLAISKAAAQNQKVPYHHYIHSLYSKVADKFHLEGAETPPRMPIPMFNVLNGGAHTAWQTTNFQEFMIVPHGAGSFKEALEQGTEVYHYLKAVLKEHQLSTLVGDEGGFAPKLKSDEQALELLMQAIEKAGFKPGKEIAIALDPATSELYENHKYHLKTQNLHKTTSEMVELWQNWVKNYPIISLEDGLAEDDWEGWHQLNQALGQKIMLVGDDFLVTNTQRIEEAIAHQTCNALLMKVNQIGTISESLQAITMSRKAGWKVIVSHRSGETEDTAIADIAVGVGAEFVKMGAPARSERTAKYNQLLRIEEEL